MACAEPGPCLPSCPRAMHEGSGQPSVRSSTQVSAAPPAWVQRAGRFPLMVLTHVLGRNRILSGEVRVSKSWVRDWPQWAEGGAAEGGATSRRPHQQAESFR